MIYCCKLSDKTIDLKTKHKHLKSKNPQVFRRFYYYEIYCGKSWHYST